MNNEKNEKCNCCFASVQLLNLKPNEIGWLSEHMGHNVAIHNAAYRLHTSAIEITKVGRLLTALDRGDITKQQGKGLSSLEIESTYC